MSGLENILSIIDSQQKENEKKIMDHAENKVREIMSEAEDKADKAYKEYIQRATLKNEHDYNTACSSIDSAMKRKILDYKVKRINEAIEKAYQKLHNLPDTEYFQLIEKLAKRDLRKGDGVISMCSNVNQPILLTASFSHTETFLRIIVFVLYLKPKKKL